MGENPCVDDYENVIHEATIQNPPSAEDDGGIPVVSQGQGPSSSFDDLEEITHDDDYENVIHETTIQNPPSAEHDSGIPVVSQGQGPSSSFDELKEITYDDNYENMIHETTIQNPPPAEHDGVIPVVSQAQGPSSSFDELKEITYDDNYENMIHETTIQNPPSAEHDGGIPVVSQGPRSSFDELEEITYDDFENSSSGSSDGSYDVMEREESCMRFCDQMSDKPCTNYEGANERNAARLRNLIATGLYVSGEYDEFYDENGKLKAHIPPVISPQEKERRENAALQGARHLCMLARMIIRFLQKGEDPNIIGVVLILKKLVNYSYSPLMITYAHPVVGLVRKLTKYKFDREVRALARECYRRFSPMFPIPQEKTFTMVFEETVNNTPLPIRGKAAADVPPG